MKKKKESIKNLLKSTNLTETETQQLKTLFEKFILTKDIMKRKSLETETKEDLCFGLDSIVNRIEKGIL